MDDGVTYKKHVVRRLNGTLERAGEFFRDGRYEQKYIDEDGVTPMRDRYFDARHHFLMETIYRWNARHTETYVYAKIVSAELGQHYISIYREDETLLATLKHSDGADEGTLFDATGTKMVAEWKTDMTYFAYAAYGAGPEVPTQILQSVMGRLKVTVLNADHKVVLQQLWQERPDPHKIGSKIYLLMSASTNFEGTVPGFTVEMSGNGSHPMRLIVSDKDGKTIENLDESGKNVASIEKMDSSGRLLPASPENNRSASVEIPPDLLAFPERADVPNFTDYGPPLIYDYR